MRKLFKKSLLSILALTMALAFNNIKTLEASNKQLTKEQIIAIADTHVKKVWQGFYVDNEAELIEKIGKENVISLKKHIENQNIELAESRNRHVIGPVEDLILNFYGVTKEIHWFGDR